MSTYDLMIIGQLSLDINTDFGGLVERAVGGAVIFSGFAADASGARTAVLPKGNAAIVDPLQAFSRRPGIKVYPLASKTCTSISNTYLTADRERRTCKAISHIEPYTPADLPEESAAIYHIAGLMTGDIGEDVIEAAAARGDCAVDVQCLLRRDEGGDMVFRDWARKKEFLPKIRYLKTDAAEAEILTGSKDRREAARMLSDWGAREIMITHNTEAIVYDGRDFYAHPLKPRNLTGRTGRGDTTFAGYLAMRLHQGIDESLLYASALVSLKMETPGPFMGTREDVYAHIKALY